MVFCFAILAERLNLTLLYFFLAGATSISILSANVFSLESFLLRLSSSISLLSSWSLDLEDDLLFKVDLLLLLSALSEGWSRILPRLGVPLLQVGTSRLGVLEVLRYSVVTQRVLCLSQLEFVAAEWVGLPWSEIAGRAGDSRSRREAGTLWLETAEIENVVKLGGQANGSLILLILEVDGRGWLDPLIFDGKRGLVKVLLWSGIADCEWVWDDPLISEVNGRGGASRARFRASRLIEFNAKYMTSLFFLVCAELARLRLLEECFFALDTDEREFLLVECLLPKLMVGMVGIAGIVGIILASLSSASMWQLSCPKVCCLDWLLSLLSEEVIRWSLGHSLALSVEEVASAERLETSLSFRWRSGSVIGGNHSSATELCWAGGCNGFTNGRNGGSILRP